MGKTGVKEGGETQNSFFKVKTFSVSQIIAAGGATAFANQIGKQPNHIVDRLSEFKREDFLTEDEAKSALKDLKDNQ